MLIVHLVYIDLKEWCCRLDLLEVMVVELIEVIWWVLLFLLLFSYSVTIVA